MKVPVVGQSTQAMDGPFVLWRDRVLYNKKVKKIACLHRYHHQRGVTIVELMIAIAIAAIALGFGIPMLTNTIAGHQVDDAFREMRVTLDAARNKAIAKKTYVTVCPRLNATSDQCYAGSLGSEEDTARQWGYGYITHADRGTPQAIASPDWVMSISSPIHSKIEIKFSESVNFIRFSPYGESNVSVVISFCVRGATDEYYAKEIDLENGRIRATSKEKTACL